MPKVKPLPQWITSKQGWTPKGALKLHSERTTSVRTCTQCNGTRINYIKSVTSGTITMRRCGICKGSGVMIR